MPTKDGLPDAERRAVEAEIRAVLAALGYGDWGVDYRRNPAPDGPRWAVWPRDVGTAGGDAWERLFDQRTVDARIVAKSIARTGHATDVRVFGGLPFVLVWPGPERSGPDPYPITAPDGEGYASDRRFVSTHSSQHRIMEEWLAAEERPTTEGENVHDQPGDGPAVDQVEDR